MMAVYEGRLRREERWDTFGRDDPAELDPDTRDVGSAGAGKSEADVVFALAWGHDEVVSDFDPQTGIVIIDRLGRAKFQVEETAAGVVLSVPSNNQALTLAGLKLRDLKIGNFRFPDENAAEEVLDAITRALQEPASGKTDYGRTTETGSEGGWFDVVYENDGANPPVPSDVSDAGGVIWPADFSADDIIGFNPLADEIDFDSASAQGAVLAKTPAGEAVIDDPRGQDMQILQGMLLSDLSVENFGRVSNQYLRLDIGGILSWEKGVGPRDADTVYIRSHEYGVSQVIEGFDPLTRKISFLYFGARGHLTVEDTPDGMVIMALPSGQKFIFTGVAKADLVAGNLEFRRDQVMRRGKLSAAFGAVREDVHIVSRNGQLTLKGPERRVEICRARQKQEALSECRGFETKGSKEAVDASEVSAPGREAGGAVPETDLDTGQKFQDWGREFVALSLNPAEDMLDFRDLRPSSRQNKPAGRKLPARVKKKRGVAGLVKTRNTPDTLM